MQVLIEFVAALVSSLAVAVFAQFGIDLRASEPAGEPEIQRTMQREPLATHPTYRAGSTREC